MDKQQLEKEVEKLNGELAEVRRVLFDQQLSNAKALEEVIKRDAQYEELRKEARFRIDLAHTWVEQLRKALGEAKLWVLADPDHDPKVLARIESTLTAVDCTKDSIPMKCSSCHEVKDDVQPYCNHCYMEV